MANDTEIRLKDQPFKVDNAPDLSAPTINNETKVKPKKEPEAKTEKEPVKKPDKFASLKDELFKVEPGLEPVPERRVVAPAPLAFDPNEEVNYVTNKADLADEFFFNTYRRIGSDVYATNESPAGLIEEQKMSQSEQELYALWKTNKTKALVKMNEEASELPFHSQVSLAVAYSVAQALTTKSYPELDQVFSLDTTKGFSNQVKQLIENPVKAVYLVSSLGADILVNMGLAALTGGGYKSFIAWQTATSSTSVYNNVKEQLRADPMALKNSPFNIKPENAPAVFAVTNGVANLMTGIGAPILTRRILNRWATDKVIKSALFHTAVNAIENSAQNLTEQSIMNYGLRGELGTNMFAVSIAGLMGAGMGYGKARYGLKSHPDLNPDYKPKEYVRPFKKIFTGEDYTPKDYINYPRPMDVRAKEFAKKFLGEDLAAFEDSKVVNKLNKAMIGEPRPSKDIVGDSLLNLTRESQKAGIDPSEALKKKLMTKGEDTVYDTEMVASGLLGTVSAGGDIPPANMKGRVYGDKTTPDEFKTLNHEIFRMVKNDAEWEGVADPSVENMLAQLPIQKDHKKVMDSFFKSERKAFENELRFKAREVVKEDFANKMRSENPDITDASIAAQFTKIDYSTKEMWKQFVDNVNNDMPTGYDQKLKHISDKIDKLNLDDLVKESNMFDLFFENLNEGVLDVNKTTKNLQKRIDEVANFKLYDGVSTKLNNVLEATGLERLVPTAIELSSGKKYLDKKLFDQKTPGILNLYNKYKGAAMRLIPEFFTADHAWFEDGQTMRLNSNRAAFTAIDPNLFEAISTLYYDFKSLGPSNGKIKTKTNRFFDDYVDFTEGYNREKIRSYIEAVGLEQHNKKKLNIEVRDVLGHKDISVPIDFVKKFDMTDAEIVAAHKSANFNDAINKLRLLNESKVPQDYGQKVYDLPDFHEASAQLNDNMYHPVVWSEDGKTKLRQMYPGKFRIQDEPHASIYKPAGYTGETRSHSEFRLDPLEEMNQHFRKMSSTMFHRPIRKDLDNIALQMFDTVTIDNATNKKTGFLDLEKLFGDAAESGNPTAARLKRVLDQHNNILKKGETAGKAIQVIGNVIAPFIQGVTRSVLGTWKVAMHLMNTGQPYGSLSPYLKAKNVLKNVPEGYVTLVKHFVKNKADISKTQLDIISGKTSSNDPKSIRYGERIDYYTKNNYDAGQEKGHYSFKGEDRAFTIPWRKNKWLRENIYRYQDFVNVMETAGRYVFDGMVISDFSSRVWGIGATLSFLDEIYGKYEWADKKSNRGKIYDSAHAIKEISALEKDLNLAGMGPIPQKELSSALLKGLKSGDMADFENKYIFHVLDSGLYHYDIANRHVLYDKARAHSKLSSMVVRFSSWTLYDIELHRRVFTDAITMRNPVALTRMIGLTAFGYALKLGLNKYCEEDSVFCKQSEKFFWNRSPATRIYESITNKYENPYGIVGSAMLQIKKSLVKGYQGEFYYPNFLPKSPVTADDVKDMYRNLRNMIQKEGTEKDKKEIDILGRAVFDMLDNPEKGQDGADLLGRNTNNSNQGGSDLLGRTPGNPARSRKGTDLLGRNINNPEKE